MKAPLNLKSHGWCRSGASGASGTSGASGNVDPKVQRNVARHESTAIPRWSMYGIFTYTYPKKWPSFVGTYSIHQASIGSFHAKVISVGIDAVAVCNLKNTCGRCDWSDRGWGLRFPICSMYSIFTYIWIIYGVDIPYMEHMALRRKGVSDSDLPWCQCFDASVRQQTRSFAQRKMGSVQHVEFISKCMNRPAQLVA